MISKDEEKMYVNFCRNYLLRAMRNSKQRYIRKEKKKVEECILNAKNPNGIEYEKIILGDLDINLEQFLKIPENFENRDLYYAFQKLSDTEKDIVIYRLEGYKFTEINKLMNFKRKTTAGEIFNRALKKMRKSMLNNLYKTKGGQENE